MTRKILFIITYILIIVAVYFSAARANGYNRSNWKHWIDIDSDCQRTRTEVLIRDSLIPPIFKTAKQCKVLFGLWVCPYTGFEFKEPRSIDIDHVVPLANAWGSGAAKWSKKKKLQFANDMDNLIAVQAKANRIKGAKGPAGWRPDNKAFWKPYAFKWIRIKSKYGLTYTQPELNALFLMLHRDPKHGGS